MSGHKKVKSRIVWEYDGEKGVHIDEFGWGWMEDDGEPNFFWWQEGNGSCDCNRSIEFGLAKKYPERCLKDDGHLVTFPCGETIKILSIEPLL
jgi:hypothetical protein